MIEKLLKKIEEGSDCNNHPTFSVGDTLRISARVREGDKTRLQMFEGIVIARKGSGVSETFTVRKISHGVGVERVFPINSPRVEKIDIIRKGKVRRSKLYYLRDRVGKAALVKEKL